MRTCSWGLFSVQGGKYHLLRFLDVGGVDGGAGGAGMPSPAEARADCRYVKIRGGTHRHAESIVVFRLTDGDRHFDPRDTAGNVNQGFQILFPHAEFPSYNTLPLIGSAPAR